MHKVEFILNKKKIVREIPAEWNELSLSNLIAFCRLIVQQLSPQHLRDAIAYRFLKPGIKTFFRMNRGQLDAINTHLEWMFTDECTLTTFPLVKFRHRYRNYYSPGHNLRFSTVAEIAYTDTYLLAYKDSKNEEHLCNLIAALYRPATITSRIKKLFKGGDVRCGFNNFIADRRSKKFKKLPQHIKQAILYQFIGCRTMNVKNNPELYKEAAGNKFGWAATIISLAGPEIGTIEKVEKMHWNSALLYMKKAEHDRQKIQNEFEQKKAAAKNQS